MSESPEKAAGEQGSIRLVLKRRNWGDRLCCRMFQDHVRTFCTTSKDLGLTYSTVSLLAYFCRLHSIVVFIPIILVDTSSPSFAMLMNTRPSNKNAHPGLPDLEHKAKRRTSMQVQAAQADKAKRVEAKHMKKVAATDRLASLEASIQYVQQAAARNANHSLPALPASVRVTAPLKRNGKSTKAKSVSTKIKDVPLVTEMAMDVDTEVDDIQNELPKPPTKRQSAKGATREDIANAKRLQRAAEGTQGLEDAREPLRAEKAAAAKTQGGKRKGRDER